MDIAHKSWGSNHPLTPPSRPWDSGRLLVVNNNTKINIMTHKFEYHTEWLTKQYIAKLEEIFEGHEFTNVSYVNDLCDTIEMDGMIAIMTPNSLFEGESNEDFTSFTIRQADGGEHNYIVTLNTFDELVAFISDKLLLEFDSGDGHWFVSQGTIIYNPTRTFCGRFQVCLQGTPEDYFGESYTQAYKRVEDILKARELYNNMVD